ncbi:MAG: 5-methylcytosine-specific restriction enzyme [Nocardioidaceae bacterium]|jgi:5-methylcytosine-specific restriction protein A|nr:5-methylcytosine-specific restriction enzyme [Nocardioidaceae bacterium]
MPRAPRQCPGDHGACPIKIANTRYCPEHSKTKWSGQRSPSSTITSTAEWKRVRPKILQRDGHLCQIRTPGICTHDATTVDHVTATSAGGAPYEPSNLQSACTPCNRHKATAERVAARANRGPQPRPWKRDTERHPGLLR